MKNKSKVEGSISNANLLEESTSFCSYYFEDYISTKARNIPRNEDVPCDEDVDDENLISIFRQYGRPFGKRTKRYLRDDEYKAAAVYVLLNCDEVSPYFE